MELSARIEGLDEAMRAMMAAFPDNAKQQRKLLNQSMSGAAKKTIVPMAKQLALRGDESGALSDSIAVRARSARKAMARGAAASVVITPLRSDKKALAKYIQHYYNSRGLAAPLELAVMGIRHGHLIEFGTKDHPAFPFLYPSAMAKMGAYTREFAKSLKAKTEAAVKRARRK